MKNTEYRLRMLNTLKKGFETYTIGLIAIAIIVILMLAVTTTPEAEVVEHIGDIIGYAIFGLTVYSGLTVMVIIAKKQAEKEEESDT